MPSSHTALVALALALVGPVAAQNLTTLIIPDVSETASYEAAFGGEFPQDRAFIRLLADGAVRSEVTQQSGSGTATGSLGLQATTTLRGYRTDATFLVSVVGAADDVTESYGRALLSPASGSTLNAGLIDLRLHDVVGDVDLRAYGSVSTSNWATAEAASQSVSAGVLGAGLLIGSPILSGRIGRATTAAVTLDGGLSYRGLFGDLTLDANRAFLESAIPTGKTRFLGTEVALGVQINGIKTGISYYHFFEDIPGFGRGQVVAGIGIQTPILSGTLSRTAARR